MKASLTLEVVGPGIIFYSPRHAEHIRRGEDYLTSSYMSEADVQRHIQAGTIIGFCTGSPGVFILDLRDGYPTEEHLHASEYKLRLGLHCVCGVLCFRDLFDLACWDPLCPSEQTVQLQDGYYHVTLCSEKPNSGILGDKQRIELYFSKLQAFPRLDRKGIPTLCM